MPRESPKADERSLPRFSLGCLLIGFAILSAVAGGLAMLGQGAYVAIEAEKNLIAYRSASLHLAQFVDQHGRWPRDEQELTAFAYAGSCLIPPEEPFGRTVIAYDFDLDRDSLAPETFRGLRYREPIYPGPADDARDRLVASLRICRDLQAPRPTSPVGQAAPDDAMEESADAQGKSAPAAAE